MKRTPLQNLLKLKLFSGGSGVPTEEKTATGNPATFTTDISKPMTQCKALFTPVQSGSGDPSSQNVRPITGFTGINIYHSGEDKTDYDTYAVTFPAGTGTVYGGSVNLITGVLTVDYKAPNLSSETWVLRSENESRQIWQIATPDRQEVASSELLDAYSSEFAGTTASGAWSVGRFAPAASGGGNVVIFVVPPASYTTSSEVQTGMADVQFVYRLKEPLTFQLTEQQITAIVGENNLWSDVNGNLEIKYLMKT